MFGLFVVVAITDVQPEIRREVTREVGETLKNNGFRG